MYTHLGQGINVLRDPPKSPLKRGTLNPAPPFLRGVGGDQTQLRLDPKTCVYTVALQGEGLRVRETLGFKLDEVYLIENRSDQPSAALK